MTNRSVVAHCIDLLT